MPTRLGQCYLTRIFPSKVAADSICPNKEGLLFSIGGIILIAANIFLVVKLLPTSPTTHFRESHWCISQVVNTHVQPFQMFVINRELDIQPITETNSIRFQLGTSPLPSLLPILFTKALICKCFYLLNVAQRDNKLLNGTQKS